MKRYFVFSDVHGNYDILIKTLEEKGFDINNKNHIIVSLGDNLDRFDKSVEVFKFLKYMKDSNRAILVIGNHEELHLEAIERKEFISNDLVNGVVDTMYSFLKEYLRINVSRDEFISDFNLYSEKLKSIEPYKLINEMIDYYETKKYIFVHGYIPVKKNDKEYSYLDSWREVDKLAFSDSRWLDGQKIYFKYNIYEKDKKIVFGHIPCAISNYYKKNKKKIYLGKLNDDELRKYSDYYIDDHIIALDSYITRTKMLNILVFEEDEL